MTSATQGDSRPVRTRFAPSPTGELHIGGVRTALFSYLYAKHFGGQFLLRIEDTDRERFVEGSEGRILDGLRWLGLEPDEYPGGPGEVGPYRQSDRLKLYAAYAKQLIESGNAYYCFCTKERLDQLRSEQAASGLPTKYDGLCCGIEQSEAAKRVADGESAVIRLKMPKDGEVVFTDMVRGKVSFSYKGFDDSVIMKSDGYPTYHLAVVVDDHLMGITHVHRSEEWLPSTPKHLRLYEAFGWEPPQFAHVSLVMNHHGRKLSKRHDGESVWVASYKEQGYLPEALVNYLVMLGWNPKTTEEKFSLQELVDRFDGSGMNKAGGVFDLKRLDHMNGEYLRALTLGEFQRRAWPFLKTRVDESRVAELSDEQRSLLWQIEQNRVARLADVGQETRFVFVEQQYDPALLVWRKSDATSAKAELQRAWNFLDGYAGSFQVEHLEKELLAMLDEHGVGKGDFLWPLRIALTGMKNSPSPFEALALLGCKESIRRVGVAIEKLGDGVSASA